MTASRLSVLVVGAGIGGLSAALALAQRGMRVQVLEAAPELGEVGAGIQLGPNAVRVLDELKVYAAMEDAAVRPDELVCMDALSGERITSLDTGDAFIQRYGHPYVVVHRGDLQRGLLEGCRTHGVRITTNKRLNRVEDLGDFARAYCEDGSVHDGDVLVGADGLRSQVRQLIDDSPPRRHPFVAYRGTVPTRSLSPAGGQDAMLIWVGPGLHLVQYKVRAGNLYNQVGVFHSPTFSEQSDDWGGPDELDAAFSFCCEPVADASRMLNRTRRWPMIDRDPIDSWTKNRITILGDAAHPMQPYLAQGGCQAIEDAAALARRLSDHEDPAKALIAYQQERAPRSASVVLNARRLGEAFHIDGIGVELRNAVFGRHAADDFTPFDWLYQPAATFVPGPVAGART